LLIGGVSALCMLTATTTEPMVQIGETPDRWIHRAVSGEFTGTVATLAGAQPGWLALIPFLAPLTVAIVLAAPACRGLRFTRRETAVAAAAFLGWVLVATAAPTLLESDTGYGVPDILVLVGLLAVALLGTSRFGIRALLLALPLGVLAAPEFAGHTKRALVLLALAVPCALALFARASMRPRKPGTVAGA
jgi:hypothetical protein